MAHKCLPCTYLMKSMVCYHFLYRTLTLTDFGYPLVYCSQTLLYCLIVPDEGYYRNASCTLHFISTFLFEQSMYSMMNNVFSR